MQDLIELMKICHDGFHSMKMTVVVLVMVVA